jgi:hypothetical protein
MRLAVLLPVLICVAAPAHAEGPRENRYGPTTPRQQAAAVATAAARYDGPMLGWANKRQAGAAVVAATASAPTRPAPLAPWAGYQGPSPASSAQAATAPVKDWSDYRSTRVAAAAPVGAPTPPPPAPPPAPPSAPTPTPTSLYAQPIVRQAIAPPPPAVQPRQVAAIGTGATGPRYYSVGREYGLTPDALPPPGPDSRVLITAAEPPPEPKDAVPMHGSADWLAAGVSGDDGDADSSAERRAKTRNQGQ